MGFREKLTFHLLSSRVWQAQFRRASWLVHFSFKMDLQLRDSAGLSPASPFNQPIRGRKPPSIFPNLSNTCGLPRYLNWGDIQLCSHFKLVKVCRQGYRMGKLWLLKVEILEKAMRGNRIIPGWVAAELYLPVQSVKTGTFRLLSGTTSSIQ